MGEGGNDRGCPRCCGTEILKYYDVEMHASTPARSNRTAFSGSSVEQPGKIPPGQSKWYWCLFFYRSDFGRSNGIADIAGTLFQKTGLLSFQHFDGIGGTN